MDRAVTIIGAGTAGLVTALLCRQAGYAVHIYEAQPDPRLTQRRGFSSGSVTLSERGLLTFDKLGLRNLIQNIAVPLAGQQVHPSAARPYFIPYSFTGAQLWCVRRDELDLALIDEVSRTQGISLCFDATCTAIEPSSRMIYLSRASGQEDAAVLSVPYEHLIGADGPRSRIRSLLAAKQLVRETFTPTEFRFVEFIIPDSAKSRAEFKPNQLQLWPRDSYFAVCFPLSDGSFIGALFVRAETTDTSVALGDLLPASRLTNELADLDRVAGSLWERLGRSPLRQLTTVTVTPWQAGEHILLLGDAAHVVLPFLGQGMNAALEDADLFLSQLCTDGGGWAAAAAAFHQNRRPQIEALGRLSRAHFDRLSRTVNDPEAPVIAYERELAAAGGEGIMTPYQLIEFTRMPYTECERYAQEFAGRVK